MSKSDEAKRLLNDPAFQDACESLESQLKNEMALAVTDVELQLAHRKIKVLYLLIEQLAVIYQTAIYDAKTPA